MSSNISLSSSVSGNVVAMAGNGCAAVASDHPIFFDGENFKFDFGSMFKVNPLIFVAFSGCREDVARVKQRMKLRQNMFGNVTPEIYAQNLANYLREPRLRPYKVNSVVGGLFDDTVKPFVCSVNGSGLITESANFAAFGSCPVIGSRCAALWKPNLKPCELLKVITDSVFGDSEHKCTNSWGVTIYVAHKKSEQLEALPDD